MQLFHIPGSLVPQQRQTPFESILAYRAETFACMITYAGAAGLPSAGLSLRFFTREVVDVNVEK